LRAELRVHGCRAEYGRVVLAIQLLEARHHGRHLRGHIRCQVDVLSRVVGDVVEAGHWPTLRGSEVRRSGGVGGKGAIPRVDRPGEGSTRMRIVPNMRLPQSRLGGVGLGWE